LEASTTALIVERTGGALIRDARSRPPERFPQLSDEPADEQAIESWSRKKREPIRREMSRSALTVVPKSLSATSAVNERWKAVIPAGAVFYDEMAQMEQGVGLTGQLISVRI